MLSREDNKFISLNTRNNSRCNRTLHFSDFENFFASQSLKCNEGDRFPGTLTHVGTGASGGPSGNLLGNVNTPMRHGEFLAQYRTAPLTDHVFYLAFIFHS